MKKSDSLTNLSLYYLIGNLFSKLFSFVLIFLVTHSLSKEDIGEYDLIFTALSFITPVISLQIGTSVLRWLLASSSEEESSDVVRTGFFILLLGCSVYTVVFLFSMIFISFRNAAFLYMISVLQVVFYTLQQTVRGLGRNFLFTFSGVVNTLLFVVFSFLSLYVLQLGLSGLLAASVASLAISIAVVFFGGNLSFCFHRHFNFSLAKRMIAYSLPLLPNAISWWLITSATRFIILYYLGVEANAVFAISFRFPMLVMFLTDIFYLAWQEKAIKSATDNTANYSGVLKKYLSLILSIIILLSGVSKLVIELLADKSYSGSWPIVPILLYAVFPRNARKNRLPLVRLRCLCFHQEHREFQVRSRDTSARWRVSGQDWIE